MKFLRFEYKCDKKLEILFKILAVISCPFYTLLLSNRFLKLDIIVSMILSFVVFLIFTFTKLKIKRINISKLILVIMLSITYIVELSNHSYRNIKFLQPIVPIIKRLYTIELSKTGLNIIMAILSLPFIILIIYKFIDFIIPKIKQFILSLSRIERVYLLVIILIAIITSIIITSNTSVFTFPVLGKSNEYCDVIYTADSGMLLKGNGYVNASFMEIDIRLPLF